MSNFALNPGNGNRQPAPAPATPLMMAGAQNAPRTFNPLGTILPTAETVRPRGTVAQSSPGYSGQETLDKAVPAEVGTELAGRASRGFEERFPWVKDAQGDRANNVLFQNRADLAKMLTEARTSGDPQQIAYLTNLVNQSNDPTFKSEYLGMLQSNAPLSAEQQLERTRNSANPRRKERDYIAYLEMNGVNDSEQEYQNWLKLQEKPATPAPVEPTPRANTVTEPTVEVPASMPENGDLPNAGEEPPAPTPRVEEKNGEPKKGFDWGKVLEIAGNTGMGLAGILQAAIQARTDAMTGNQFDFERSTTLGRKAKETRENRAREQELAFEEKLRGADRQFQVEQAALDRQFQERMAQAKTEQERIAAQEAYRQESALLAQRIASDERIASMQASAARGAGGAGFNDPRGIIQ